MNLYRDLSEYSKLISNFFKWPVSSAEWDKYRLNEEQVLFFKENGYLHNVKLIEHWQVDRLREELEQIMDPPIRIKLFFIRSGTGG